MTVKEGNLVAEGLKEWKQELLSLQGDNKSKLEGLKNESKLIVAKNRCLQAAKDSLGNEKGARKDTISKMSEQLDEDRRDLQREIDILESKINTQEQVNEVVFREIDKKI
ncbi:hypothetical protein [Bacillus pseudomycoides]|uniref:hypothetical protein n=1 Tax=Bacillus pseudomycoides TaxID=64104 RepID=UPI000BEBD2D8|nr:hypothetical protein [Bacillus pseudomycoides]PEE42805.1 hypothetical protein COO02_05655 [Bacillus pseudomycoides]PGA90888.1 hypothetical protein COL91_12300 [Bacillus pseudomycoides]